VAHGTEDDKLHGNGCEGPCFLWYLTSSFCLPQCYLGPKLRGEVRKRYNLQEAPCGGAQLLLLLLALAHARMSHAAGRAAAVAVSYICKCGPP
jgi:hypothetical protein